MFLFLLVYNYNLIYSYYFLLYLNINKPQNPEQLKLHFFIQQATGKSLFCNWAILPQNRNFQILAFDHD